MARIVDDGSSFSHGMAQFRAAAFSGGGSVSEPSFRTCCADQKFLDYWGPDGHQLVPVSCGKCKHCRWSRRSVMANKIFMERMDADWAVFITLTLDDLRIPAGADWAKVLNPVLLQNFQKTALNHKKRRTHAFAGRDCTSWRYVQCGEYGSRHGRAHFHAVIFGKGDRPSWADNPDPHARIRIDEWPWGLVNVNANVDSGVGYYLGKYMQKPDRRGNQTWHSQSNGYAIGARYLQRLAVERAASFAVPTNDFKFVMQRGVLTPCGRNGGSYFKGRRTAMARGAGARDFLIAYAAAKDKPLLSLVKNFTPMVRTRARASVLWQRRREFAAKHGYVPEVNSLADDRIKLKVLNEYRAAMGLVPMRGLWDLVGKPAGWVAPARARGSGVAGREALKRWSPDWRSNNADPPKSQQKPVTVTEDFSNLPVRAAPRFGWSKLDDLETDFAARKAAAACAPACSCASCQAAFGSSMAAKAGPRSHRLHMGEVALARAAYAESSAGAEGAC